MHPLILHFSQKYNLVWSLFSLYILYAINYLESVNYSILQVVGSNNKSAIHVQILF